MDMEKDTPPPVKKPEDKPVTTPVAPSTPSTTKEPARTPTPRHNNEPVIKGPLGPMPLPGGGSPFRGY